jgi:tonB-dependent siderophore receptor
LTPNRAAPTKSGSKANGWTANWAPTSPSTRDAKKNVAVKAGKHPDDTDYYRAADRVKNHGWEIGIGGEIKDGWLIHANYSHNRAKDRSGKRINTDIPADQIKLATSYAPDNHWQIGGSLNWESKTRDTPRIDDPVIRAAHTNKAHTTLDLMARYRINDHFRLGLNANNIFNSKYRTAIGSQAYGAPRHIMATLRYEF